MSSDIVNEIGKFIQISRLNIDELIIITHS